MALLAEVRSGRAFRIGLHSSLRGGVNPGGPDAAPQHARSRCQSHMPIRDTLNTPYEAPRLAFRHYRTNPCVSGRGPNSFSL